ncbi:MAG: hypothetical protein AAGJ35_04900 [Myxococcota bacterium]
MNVQKVSQVAQNITKQAQEFFNKTVDCAKDKYPQTTERVQDAIEQVQVGVENLQERWEAFQKNASVQQFQNNAVRLAAQAAVNFSGASDAAEALAVDAGENVGKAVAFVVSETAYALASAAEVINELIQNNEELSEGARAQLEATAEAVQQQLINVAEFGLTIPQYTTQVGVLVSEEIAQAQEKAEAWGKEQLAQQ